MNFNRMILTRTWTHLHNLPRHVKDAASCPAEEAPQAGDWAISDHTSSYRLSITIQQFPPLPSFFPLLQLKLPLLFVVT